MSVITPLRFAKWVRRSGVRRAQLGRESRELLAASAVTLRVVDSGIGVRNENKSRFTRARPRFDARATRSRLNPKSSQTSCAVAGNRNADAGVRGDDYLARPHRISHASL